MQFEEYKVNETFFLFELGGVDVILGVTWLATLEDVKVNLKTLFMNLCTQGQPVKIKGDPTLTKTLVTPKVLRKESEKGFYYMGDADPTRY